MENFSGKRQRWHDNRGDLSTAFDMLTDIPKEVLPLIADGIILKADKDFNAEALLRSLKSLGSEKVMALYQSRKKRREYDQDPDLFRIVNHFFVLPEQNQDKLARDFIGFTDLVVEYMATCESFDKKPLEKELHEIRNHFVNNGLESASKYLHTLHKDYEKIVNEDETSQVVITSEKGMKVARTNDEDE